MKEPQSLPFSKDSELGLLCSMILSQEVLSSCETVPASVFYLPAHQVIFQSLLEFHKLDRPVDFRSLKHHLETKKQLDEVGGVEGLNAVFSFVLTPANWRYYCDIVTDRYQRRTTILSCQKIMAQMHDVLADTSCVIRDEAEKALSHLAMETVAQEKSFREKVLETVDELNSLSEKVARTGALFGIKSLDDETCGMLPKELWVIAAETSQGKSALATQAAMVSTLIRHLYTVIFSLEMGANEVIKRMMSRQGRVPMQGMRNGVFPLDRDYVNLVRASEILMSAPMQIYDDFELDWKRIVSQCRKKKIQLAKEGKRIGFIVIDYIQLIEGDEDEERKELEISKIVRKSKSLAKEMDCPILAISQLNEQGKLYGARSIKHHVDGLLILRPRDTPGDVEILLAKMRNGPRDRIFPARFDGSLMNFTDPPRAVAQQPVAASRNGRSYCGEDD